ncbi:2-keto-4-pentenoate hydratase [Roseobacteraceae bacterium NS-SX3]
MKPMITAAALALAAGPGWAGCASEAEIAAFTESYMAGRPAKALVPEGSMEDALCTQARLAAALEPHMGPVIGYKAGLTSPPAQERFGVSEPVRGVLYENMMLAEGAAVPVPWGAVPMVEADLVLVIRDAAVNEAETVEQALQHIAAIRPFIELPDLTLARGEPLTGVTITAMGVGARLGVLGAEVPVQDSAAMAQALAAMTVTLRSGSGETLAEAPGTAVLGHPVNALLWLRSKGVEFKPGDLVSVGSFGPLFAPQKLQGGATVEYTGLPGDPSVSVRFEPAAE